MRPSPIIYLLLSSILLLSGCAISKYKRLSCDKSQTYIEPVFGLNSRDKHHADSLKSMTIFKNASLQKYKVSIDVLKNHLTGLLIVKQTDSITKHFVFVTELGMKMFDFEAKNNKLKVVYVFEPLNKPLMIESLLRNFSNMFFLNVQDTIVTECYNKKLPRVVKVRQAKDSWFYSSPNDDSQNIIPRLQETFHKRRRASKIDYTYDKTNGLYTTIKAKQYGLVKFYFELNLIPPTND